MSSGNMTDDPSTDAASTIPRRVTARKPLAAAVPSVPEESRIAWTAIFCWIPNRMKDFEIITLSQRRIITQINKVVPSITNVPWLKPIPKSFSQPGIACTKGSMPFF